MRKYCTRALLLLGAASLLHPSSSFCLTATSSQIPGLERERGSLSIVGRQAGGISQAMALSAGSSRGTYVSLASEDGSSIECYHVEGKGGTASREKGLLVLCDVYGPRDIKNVRWLDTISVSHFIFLRLAYPFCRALHSLKKLHTQKRAFQLYHSHELSCTHDCAYTWMWRSQLEGEERQKFTCRQS